MWSYVYADGGDGGGDGGGGAGGDVGGGGDGDGSLATKFCVISS